MFDIGQTFEVTNCDLGQGVAMLSSVLRSERAILVNIQIIRAFVHMRELLRSHRELRLRIESLERLIEEDEKPQGTIGFRTD